MVIKAELLFSWRHLCVLYFWTPVLTLRAPHLAGLHESQQSNEVFNDAEVLGPRGAAGVDRHSHQHLLNVTHQELVVVQGNAAENNKKNNETSTSRKEEQESFLS